MKLEKQTFLLCYVSSHLTLDVDKIQWGFKVVNWSDYWTNGNDSFQLFNHSVLVYNKRHSFDSWTLQQTFCHLVTSSEFHYQSLDSIYWNMLKILFSKRKKVTQVKSIYKCRVPSIDVVNVCSCVHNCFQFIILFPKHRHASGIKLFSLMKYLRNN